MENHAASMTNEGEACYTKLHAQLSYTVSDTTKWLFVSPFLLLGSSVLVPSGLAKGGAPPL